MALDRRSRPFDQGRARRRLVTDVERQPFRSIGFVSVIIVSGLFVLGVPLVLL